MHQFNRLVVALKKWGLRDRRCHLCCPSSSLFLSLPSLSSLSLSSLSSSSSSSLSWSSSGWLLCNWDHHRSSSSSPSSYRCCWYCHCWYHRCQYCCPTSNQPNDQPDSLHHSFLQLIVESSIPTYRLPPLHGFSLTCSTSMQEQSRRDTSSSACCSTSMGRHFVCEKGNKERWMRCAMKINA